VPDLYAFVHDTLPPRLVDAMPIDSVSATLTFAQSLDPFQRLDSTSVSVRKLPDSTAVPVVSLAPQTTTPLRVPDTTGLRRADTTGIRRVDTTAARRLDSATAKRADTTAAAHLGGAGRPPLSDRLVLKVGEPWHPGDRFVIELHGIRTVSGTPGDPRGVLAIPEPKTTAGGARTADSLRADSLHLWQQSDSLHRKRR
jgi:hypothetical protein